MRAVVRTFFRFPASLPFVAWLALTSSIETLAVAFAISETSLPFCATITRPSRMTEASSVQALSVLIANDGVTSIFNLRTTNSSRTVSFLETWIAIAYTRPAKAPSLATAVIWAFLERLELPTGFTGPSQLTEALPAIAHPVAVAIVFAFRDVRAIGALETRVAETFAIFADTISSTVARTLDLFRAVITIGPRIAEAFRVFTYAIAVALAQYITGVDTTRLSRVAR